MVRPMMSASRILVFAAVCVARMSAPARGQAGAPFPLTVSSVTIVGEEQEFGSIVAAKLGANGNVYALDHMNARVTAFSPEGRMLWSIGRKGHGPGEFQLPYRLDVAPNGQIVVFDFATGEVTTLAPTGRFLRRANLPFSFRQVDNLVVLPNGDLIISGYSLANDQASVHGLHRFRMVEGRLVHVLSFGPLPSARDRAVLPFWGAGPVVRDHNGDILYMPRLPYEIHRYAPAGQERSTVRPRTPLRAVPDDFVRIEHTARGTQTSRREPDLERPGGLITLGNGWILASRVGLHATQWDLFDPTGRIAGTRSIPSGWEALVGYDRARNVLWLTR